MNLDSLAIPHPFSCSSRLQNVFHLLTTHFPVVIQTYNTQPIDEYVIVGNDALFKCTIPSYVTDFVSVVSWVDSDGEAILSSRLSHGILNAFIIENLGEHTLAMA